jgi:hypothetical protein
MLTMGANFEYSNASAPTGPAPWITVGIDDHGAVGSVTLTVTATNLTTHGSNTESLVELDLNVDPALDPNTLTFALLSTTGAFDLPSINKGVDAFHAAADGLYDINMMFTSGGSTSHTFTQGEVIQYTVTAPGLTAQSFNALSAPSGSGNAGPFVFVAHIQNTGSKGNGSGWVTGESNLATVVPEPTSLVASLIGAFACVSLVRRQRMRHI